MPDERDQPQPQPELDLPPTPVPSRAPRPRRGGGENRRRQESAGESLERRVGRLEFAEGAFVRLRIPVRINAEAGRDILTDLDVVAVDVDSRLRLSRSILECKSGAGQSGEPDRLLWLAGLRAFLGGPRAALVRNTVSNRGRIIAQRLNIETMDESQVTAREASIAWLPERFAHLGGEECARAEERTDELLRDVATIPPDIVAYLRGDHIFSPQRTLGVLTDLHAAVEGVALPMPVGLVLGGHALLALVLAAIRDGESLDRIPRAALEARLTRALTVGSGDGNLLQVLSQADAIVAHTIAQLHEAYEATGVTRQEVPVPRLRDIVSEAPTWIPRYADFVEALRANPSISRELLQTIELACFEGLVGGAAHEYQAFDHLFTVEHRQLLRLGIRVLEELAGEAIAAPLNALRDVRFDRVPLAVPDRRSPPQRTGASA